MNKFLKIMESCYLCIRFPFLYPRHRFTGKHYNNWKLLNKSKAIKDKWIEYSKTHQKEYYQKFGEKAITLFGEKVQIYYDEVLARSMVLPEYAFKIAPFKDKFLYWFYNFINDFLGIFHFIPTYTELDAMPSGWRKRLGMDFCKELKRQTIKDYGRMWMLNLRIDDIKEKGGQLQVSIKCGSPGMYRVIDKYSYISQFVCIDCGEDADKVSVGYYDIPYCDKHLPEGGWKWIETIYDWTHLDRVEENEMMWREDE